MKTDLFSKIHGP